LIIDGRPANCRGETIADTARVLSRYVDAIVWRRRSRRR
jgi:ornithine carbamoyltransferase